MDKSRKLGKLRRGVSIIGVGMTKQGHIATTPEIKGMTERELWHWAAREAMEDANCRPHDIQAQYVANTAGEWFTGSFHLDGALQRWCGLKRDGLGVAGCRVESACSAGAHAIREAIFSIASGVYDLVMAGGVEISSVAMNRTEPAAITNLTNVEVLKGYMTGCDRAFHYLQEPWATTIFGGWLTAYAYQYGLSKDDIYDALDGLVISRHHSAAHNPKACLNFELEDYAKERGFASAKEFLHSKLNPVEWWPVRFWDFEIATDGAACVIVCATESAREFHPDPIHVLGTGCAHGQLYNPTYSCPAIVEAAKQAYEMADLTPEDIDFVELYVCGAAVEFTAVEDIGFSKGGEYWKIVRDGRTAFDGDKPVSPSGGLKAFGDTVGAVGVCQAYEVIKQIRGEAGSRQIHPIPRIGLTHTLGGTGDTTQVINIYGRK